MVLKVKEPIEPEFDLLRGYSARIPRGPTLSLYSLRIRLLSWIPCTTPSRVVLIHPTNLGGGNGGMIEMVGKRQEKRLTPSQLKKLSGGMHADGNGLYLVVQSSGSRSWILRTTVRGKRREIGLGGLSTTSLADAREEASRLRSRARKGEDILEARRIEKRNVPTFEEATRTYHEIVGRTFKSAQHKQKWLRSLDQYVFPVMGSKTVDVIETADVLRAIGPIWNTIPHTARHTLRRIAAVFDYCQAGGH